MHINSTDIATMAEHIRANHTQHRGYPYYRAFITDTHKITLHNNAGKAFVVDTPYISDIHAILQQCHPDGAYYLTYSLILPTNYPPIAIYSHGTQPTHFTYQQPDTNNKEYHPINLRALSDIVVSTDDTMVNITNNASKRVYQHLSFIDKYPHIEFHRTQLRRECSFMPHNPHLNIILCVYADGPSTDIRIDIYLRHGTSSIGASQWILHPDNIHALEETYRTEIQPLLQYFPIAIEHVDTPYSQHERINLIRLVTHRLNAPDSDILSTIDTCVKLFRDHYIHDAPNHHTTAP